MAVLRSLCIDRDPRQPAAIPNSLPERKLEEGGVNAAVLFGVGELNH